MYMDIGRLFDTLACSREGFFLFCFVFLVSVEEQGGKVWMCEVLQQPGTASCSNCCGRNDDFNLQDRCALSTH